MFWSRNDFFKQSKSDLIICEEKVKALLKIKGRSDYDIAHYLMAYKYFVNNPSKYDGATIVKDLVDVRNVSYYLDSDAMVHDYEYVQGANRNYIKKFKSDLKYINNMELNGKGVRILRLIFLTIFGSWLPIYKLLTTKK